MSTLTEIKPTTQQQFHKDVIAGLSQRQKSIPCKWFYDEAGSIIFEEITETPEYFATRVETKLLGEVARDLSELLPELKVIVEPGSGSSIKTRILLSTQKQVRTYIPMDISADFLSFIALQLHADFPKINTLPMEGDFTHIDAPLMANNHDPRLVFFPGSTIGNFSPAEAKKLLRSFHHLSGKNGYLLIGVDGTQDEAQLLSAYDDQAGTTALFNKNILERANRELDADFNIADFKHVVKFDQVAKKIEMHLESLKNQTVTIGDHVFIFTKGETIFTESCYKYSHDAFEKMANACQWTIKHAWKDTVLSDFQIFLLQAS